MKSNVAETEIQTQTSHADVSAEVAELRKKLFDVEQAQLRQGLVPNEEIEKLVAQKMKMGLSRLDALTCARRQTLHNEVIAEQDKAVAAAIAEVSKSFPDKYSPEHINARSQAVAEVLAGFRSRIIAAGGHIIATN